LVSEVEWDESADLIVVGFGAAGSCAAIHAADMGADVLVLEKQPMSWHTPSVRASGGYITVVDDAEKALRYFDRCAGGMVPLEVSRAWVERATTILDWLDDKTGLEMIRGTAAEHPDWEGADAVSAYISTIAWAGGKTLSKAMERLTREQRETWERKPAQFSPGGYALFEWLKAAVMTRERIRVKYEHPAHRLIKDAAGRIVGVQVKTAEGTRRFRSESGVVLTCGGYEYNEEMKLSYLRAYPIYFYGSPMNTGDGVRMAQDVGADLWHMNCMIGRGMAHFEADGRAYNFHVRIPPGGYVLTDKRGQRFTNEQMQAEGRHDFYYELISFDAAHSDYLRLPCYWFFDQRRMNTGPPIHSTATAGPYLYRWSEDSSEEVARGWLHKDDDFERLAEKAGIADPQAVARSIADYNSICATKQDPLGRDPATLIPLDEPPYYCLPLWPGGSNTSGGPRRNEHAEIVDVYGDPIPGLYEAGELGEAVGTLYPAFGANLSDALCFGRIAAERALGSTTLARGQRSTAGALPGD
jgi:succinate dehydrogenase/fumarate reductase flavoprotein subunit